MLYVCLICLFCSVCTCLMPLSPESKIGSGANVKSDMTSVLKRYVCVSSGRIEYCLNLL